MVKLFALLALVLAPLAYATPTQTQGQLPVRGVFVWGQTIAGVGLGFTPTKVQAVLGKNYKLCDPKESGDVCKETLWLYTYTRGEPLGVAVKFHNGLTSAVFTLGAIQGWKTRDGLKMFDPVSSIYSLYQTPIYTKCIGFEAFSAKKGTVTTSFYTASGVVYGFALTSRGEKICQ